MPERYFPSLYKAHLSPLFFLLFSMLFLLPLNAFFLSYPPPPPPPPQVISPSLFRYFLSFIAFLLFLSMLPCHLQRIHIFLLSTQVFILIITLLALPPLRLIPPSPPPSSDTSHAPRFPSACVARGGHDHPFSHALTHQLAAGPRGLVLLTRRGERRGEESGERVEKMVGGC